MAKKPDEGPPDGRHNNMPPDYLDLPGPGKADAKPRGITQFDRYDWSRDSEPEPLFKKSK